MNAATKKTITIEVSPAELQNITHGLELLQAKALDQMQKIKPFEPGADDLRKYYKEKMNEIFEQLKQSRSIQLREVVIAGVNAIANAIGRAR